MLEGYTTLGFVAAKTETLRIRLLVGGVTYRHPGLLAKTVTTLDVLSGGRAELGIGAAWYEREHRGLGVPFPPISERFERLEETLQICLQMWSDNDGAYEGAHYQLAETLCSPPPVSSPRPRILIGGSGERKTLRLVATYADACNLFGDAATVAHKLDVLRASLRRRGAGPGQIEVTALPMVPDDAGPDALAAPCRGVRRRGGPHHRGPIGPAGARPVARRGVGSRDRQVGGHRDGVTAESLRVRSAPSRAVRWRRRGRRTVVRWSRPPSASRGPAGAGRPWRPGRRPRSSR